MNLQTLIRGKFRQGVIWNLGSVVVLGIGGILINLTIVTTRGEDALGIFNQVYSIFMLTSQVGIGGIHFSVLKQISYHQDDRDLCGDITTSGLVLAVGFLFVTCIILWMLANNIGGLLESDAVAQGVRFVVPGVFFIGLNRLLNNTINGLSLMRVYAVTQASRYIITPIVVLLLALSPLPSPYILWCFSISEFILFVVLIWYVYSQLVPLRFIQQAKLHFREHLSYASRGFLSGVVGTLNTRIDIIVLGYFTSDQIVGMYSLASTFIEGFVQIAVSIRWNIDPILGQLFARDDMEGIKTLFVRMRRVIFPLMGLLAIIAIIVYPVALSLFVDWETVILSWQVFIILMIGVVINSYYRVFKGLLLQGNRPGAFTQFVLLTIIFNVLLNSLLIPLFGLIGAAVATMFTYIIESIIMVYFVRKQLGLRI